MEVAIVLFILGLLARTILPPMHAHLEQRRIVQTEQQLERVRVALSGHLIRTGALPCPLGPSDGTPGVESPCRRRTGGVPARLLGLAGAIDARGALIDSWGRPLMYHLSDQRIAGQESVMAWTRRSVVESMDPADSGHDLSLCPVVASLPCDRRTRRADGVVFAVVSQSAQLASSPAELENLDNDSLLVTGARSIREGLAFDDQMVWMARSEIWYLLLQAGRYRFSEPFSSDAS